MSELLLDAQQVQLSYPGHLAVASSTFQLPLGGVIAIIGPNGSGKSTLLHALAGLITPSKGVFKVLGGDPRDKRDRISYVLQSVALPQGVPLSVKETVSMGLYPKLGWFGWPTADDKALVTKAMQALNITHLAKRQIGELSGGQRQRAYVAQGLCQRHEVLLLDEPMTGLDLPSKKQIDDLVHSESKKGKTVVMTTHELEEAAAADFVVLMSQRVVAHGKPAEVLTRANLERAYGLGALHETSDLFLDDPGQHLDGC